MVAILVSAICALIEEYGGFDCIFQGIIPYGAQMLVAVSVAAELGCSVSAFRIIPNLIYPLMLLISVVLFMFVW